LHEAATQMPTERPALLELRRRRSIRRDSSGFAALCSFLGYGKPRHARQYAPEGLHAPTDLIETQFDNVENEPFRSASTNLASSAS
jgi:hypothetical protein